jgi:Ca-activated chloride channel family protein
MPLLSALSRVFASDTNPNRGAEVTTSDGRSLPLVGARLRAEAKGGLARLVLEQTFENRYQETLHVTYRMPLPADGAVSAYAFQIADRTITGRVDRKASAREQFERAVSEGKTAALLEQNTNDIFTQQIGNLPAGETLVAKITVDQRLAWLAEGEWELRFPTVIGPRYVGAGDSAQVVRDTAVETAVGGIDARISIELAIGDTIVGGRQASSPTHSVRVRDNGALELRDPAALDRDLVVRWPVATREVGLAIEVARRASGDAFGLLTIVPPAREAKAQGISRDLIVLLDTSGSMSGAPLDKAKQVVAMLIESLGEADRLEMIEFSMSARRYKREPVAGTPREKADAIKWLRNRVADGGTEMASAVLEALSALRPGAQRQVVLVTDGYVGGEQKIVKLLHANLPKSCRLHVLGIGSAVNRSLATAMARAGRGAEVLVGLDEDLERGAKRMVDRTRMPVLTNVEISGSALVRHAPEHVPDVFEGAPVIAAVALRPDGGELVVRGDLARDRWEQRIRVPARREGEGNQAIAALYGREHVADLETRWTIGDQHALDREIEETGLAFQIATRLTSWIAIDESRRVTGPSRHDAVPQELPYGTTAQSFGLRAAALPVAYAMDQNQFEQGMGAATTLSLAEPQRAAKTMFSSYGVSSSPPAQMVAPEKLAGPRTAPAASYTPKRRMPILLVLLVLALALAALLWWLMP